jgi:hypothetical protein
MTCEELDKLTQQTIETIQSDIDQHEERAALQDDGKTTDQRALEALERPERFSGEHQVAQMWLAQSKTARVWSRNGR